MVWGGGKNTCKHESLNFQLPCSHVLFDSVSRLSVLAHCIMVYLLPVKQTCCILVRTRSLQWPTQRPEKTMHFKWLKTLTMLIKLKIDINDRLLWFHGNLWGTSGLKHVLQRWYKNPLSYASNIAACQLGHNLGLDKTIPVVNTCISM